jgi:PAS domain S-box-containing protein
MSQAMEFHHSSDSNFHIAQVLDAVNVGIWVAWGNAQHLYVNNAFRRLLGFSADLEIAFNRSFWKSLVHPDDIERVSESFLRVARRNQASTSTEFRLRSQHTSEYF